MHKATATLHDTVHRHWLLEALRGWTAHPHCFVLTNVITRFTAITSCLFMCIQALSPVQNVQYWLRLTACSMPVQALLLAWHNLDCQKAYDAGLVPV